VCASPGGLHRLWLLAAARLALPAGVRVEVRHDLCGIRLAQVALGFGADTLAGPIDPVRHLPLAGVPRPSEATADGLCELVRQAGLTPVLEEPDR
jgi:2-iminoacetate synthase ThiH